MDWVESYRILSAFSPELITAAIDFAQPGAYAKATFRRMPSDLGQSVLYSTESLNILADDPRRSDLDSVFAPHPESLFLAALIPRADADVRFVDIGTGSGILAITAARLGWKVYAVDTNDRALAVARINAALNNVSVEFSNEYLGQALPAECADLCIANLPFEPSPREKPNFVYADGGVYGDHLIDALLPRFESLLAVDGRAIVPAFSLLRGDCSRLEAALRRMDDKLARAIVRLSKPIETDGLLSARYGGRVARAAHVELKNEGFTHFVIEIALLARRETLGNGFLGRHEMLCADLEWLLPLGVQDLTQPGTRFGHA